ncbi:MAG: hypothetical protein CUN55_06615 [Phototrophicales bacterium]|nr:MAG: hypothetical protein CUN55_06615 [Phototrophicales bacterium]
MSQSPIAIVLAGGANSRFWPLREKSLYTFMNEPLLTRQLKVYAEAGFQNAIIIANPANYSLIVNAMAALESTISYNVVVQQEPLGMGHAILQAEDLLREAGYPPIYICQVNDVVEAQLHHRLYEAAQSGRAHAYLTGFEVSTYFPGGYLVLGDDGQRIVGIQEKPSIGHEPSNVVNIVAHVHTETAILFEHIHRLYASNHPHDDHYEVAMAAMMNDYRFECVRYDGKWHPIKYPWHVLDVMKFYLDHIDGQHIHPEAKILGEVSISGNVIIEAGARLFHGASVVGPAYIGPDAIVGNGALVRESMIGAKSVVGHVSEVARSWLGQGVNLHRAVVLDSVFEDRVNFSAGCITANLRIDGGFVKSSVKGERLVTGRNKLGAMIGEGAFIGIQSGTMPGVKIGAGAEVGAFTNVTQDILEGQRLYSLQETRLVDATGKVSEE